MSTPIDNDNLSRGENQPPIRNLVPKRDVANFGQTLVELAHLDDNNVLADGVTREEHIPGIITLLSDEGDIVAVDTAELDTVNLVPKIYERKIVDSLTAEEEVQLALVVADMERLQMLSGGIELLLHDRPAIDPGFSGDRKKLVEAARLSMLRLISATSLVRNVLALTHPDLEDVVLLAHEISEVLPGDEVEKLQRLFIGGYTGSNSPKELLSRGVNNAIPKKGLKNPGTTDRITILGPRGMKFISLIENDESEV